MPDKVCFVSVDVERDIEKMEEIIDIFKENKVVATLFATGQILEKYQLQILKWAEDYEIACHSFTHRFWNTLSHEERKKELDNFIDLYRRFFKRLPLGFRAPSHIIDEHGLEILEKNGFLYDSSIVPHYPPFKKYRGYKGRFPLIPYYHLKLPRLLEIPVRGQMFGIPLAGAWISRLPYLLYKILFFIYCPGFITLSIHSWDSLKNFKKIIKLLESKNYQFLNGEQIYQNYKQK
ncbi:MAG: polysaccharide deacetylase family protein [Candidatus Nealsonbacteria bacterium]|nr:polysaccharide deacetylase family protein [Candidatus Nealsonbacteria bacterium]